MVSVMGKVVRIDGNNTIEVLENALQMAKAGVLKNMVIAGTIKGEEGATYIGSSNQLGFAEEKGLIVDLELHLFSRMVHSTYFE